LVFPPPPLGIEGRELRESCFLHPSLSPIGVDTGTFSFLFLFFTLARPFSLPPWPFQEIYHLSPLFPKSALPIEGVGLAFSLPDYSAEDAWLLLPPFSFAGETQTRAPLFFFLLRRLQRRKLRELPSLSFFFPFERCARCRARVNSCVPPLSPFSAVNGLGGDTPFFSPFFFFP